MHLNGGSFFGPVFGFPLPFTPNLFVIDANEGPGPVRPGFVSDSFFSPLVTYSRLSEGNPYFKIKALIISFFSLSSQSTINFILGHISFLIWET